MTLPVGVGFGIRDAASAQAIAADADAVVIGSRIIQEIETGPPATARRARRRVARRHPHRARRGRACRVGAAPVARSVAAGVEPGGSR